MQPGVLRNSGGRGGSRAKCAGAHGGTEGHREAEKVERGEREKQRRVEKRGAQREEGTKGKSGRYRRDRWEKRSEGRQRGRGRAAEPDRRIKMAVEAETKSRRGG